MDKHPTTDLPASTPTVTALRAIACLIYLASVAVECYTRHQQSSSETPEDHPPIRYIHPPVR